MAKEVIDGIEFDVDIDTSGAVASTKVIDAQTQKIEKSFKGVDTQVSKTSKSVKAGLSGMGRSAGQAGIQLQQFIGQVQGGQSAMLALSQQGADLGFVIGAPLLGAVVGIAASIAGLLTPALIGTTAEVKELDKTLPRLIDKFNKLSETQQKFTREALNVQLKEQTKQYRALQVEINKIQSAYQTARTGGDSFLSNLLGESEEDLFKKLTQARTSMADVRLEIDKTRKTIKSLGENKELAETSKNIVNGLKSQIIALRDGEEASFRFSVAQQLGLKVGEKIPENIDKQVRSLFALKQAQEQAAETEKERAKNQRESEAALKAYNDETFRQLQAEERKAQAERGQASSFAGGIIGRGLTESERLEADELKLEELRAQGLLNLELYEKAKTSITEQQESLRSRISQQTNQMILLSSSSFFGEAASLAKSAAGEQSSAYKTLFAVSKGFAIANAALNLGTALSNASALPYPANIPAYVQAGVQGAQLASQIAGVTYGGGRENGGPVSAGSLYEVGEKNKPEVFQSGGKQYMIPGNNGNVISNADMQGGGAVNVKVINLPGQSASVTQQGEGVSRETVIQIITEQSAQLGSDLNRNINKNHNVTNRQGANRRN